MKHLSPELLKRYKAGNCTPEEQKIVEAWFKDDYNFFEDPHLVPETDEHVKQEIWKKLPVYETGLKRVRRIWPRLLAVACVAVAFILSGIYLFSPGFDKKKAFVTTIPLKKYITPQGHRSSVLLPDSTVVHLMGGSELAYPESFAADTREIFLNSGEAYLEVVHQPKRPFILKSGATEIKVLGTAFNVRNRANDSTITITLTQGSIRFTASGQASHILRPGQQLVFNKANEQIVRLSQIPDKNSIANWTKGLLQFNNTPLHEALQRLEEFYGIRFIVNDPVNLKIPLTATMDNLPLRKALALMSFSTHLQFTNKDSIVVVSH